MKNLLKSYLKRLTNLSAGNKSLMQLRLFKSQDLDLKDLEFLLKEQSSFQIIEKLIASTGAIKIAQVLDSRDKSNNEASKILQNINRKDQMIFNERGVHDLYVGWPIVKGKMIDGTPVRCPLLFFSVELSQNDNYWYLKREKDAPISLNRSFLLAYSYFNKVSLSDDFIETNLEDFNSDSQAFRTELYNFLKHSKLEIDFNRDLFEDQIKPFVSYKRKELEELIEVGELKLFSNAILGIYPQSDSYLVPDYEKIIPSLPEGQKVEDFFLERDHGEEEPLAGFELLHKLRFINKVREEHTFTPYKLDASQENALKAVKKGKSIVVQGPPGTGKSQLICNLISDFISRKKRVLVVCQKKVALEVVSDRLKQKGLGEFSSLLHDFKNDRKQVFNNIANQINKIDEYENLNNSLDTIYTERTFLKASREIDQISEELEEFKFALFDTNECGWSIKELYLKSNPEVDRVDFKVSYGEFNSSTIPHFLDKLEEIYPYKKKFDVWNNPFKHRLNFKDFNQSDKQQMLDYLDEIPHFIREFKNKISHYLSDPISIEDATWILDRESDIQDLLKLIATPKSFEFFKHLAHKHPDKDWFTIREKLVDDCFKQGFEQSLEPGQLGRFQEVLEISLEAQRHFWKRWFYKIFSRDAVLLRQVFKSNKLEWNKPGLKELTRRVDCRLNFQHYLSELREKEWLIEVPQSRKKEVFDRWFGFYFEALEAFTISEELRSFKEYWNLAGKPYPELKENLLSVLEICREAAEKYKKWSQYFSKSQLDHLVKENVDISPYKEALSEDFDNLCAYDKIENNLSNREKEIIEKLYSFKEGLSLEELHSLFKNSIYLHWIDHIETKYPILKEVSSMEMDTRERKIRKAVKEKRACASEIVLQKVREHTYGDIEYNRLKNRVSYRDLEHQVTKKRRLWPIRKVIQEFEEEIFQLIPCWLASPEAVSAVFPLDMKFDLVIFDEASQCFVEKGIPALHRARQVVITGDSKQLSPYDLYQVRYEEEEEEEENPLLEIDSLLDVGARFLMELDLKGHYRSKSLDLIQFSNEHFYKGKLRMLPQYEDFVSHNKGIEYRQVNGRWDRNINEEEAKEVVAICIKYIKNQPEKGVGVVTFNYKQQHYILDLLLEACEKEELLLPSNFFVKNIENVQGDEREVIIFSLGYAPTYSGKMQMNFGSLNQKGGANRLNVAITRAKEKNIIVASIMPNQLQVEDAKNEGPKLLKKYLEYAYQVSNDKFKPTYPISDSMSMDWLLKNKIIEQVATLDTEFDLSKNYHFADVVSGKDGEYDLFLTDDDLYFASDGVKDYHVYQPLSLKQKSWPFTQKYSRDYWVNRTVRLPHKYVMENKDNRH